MSRLDNGIEIFGLVAALALLLWPLLLVFGVFEWWLFYSPARLLNEQIELCVADKNTEAKLLKPRNVFQEDFGSNETEIYRGIIVGEIQTELEISEEGFKALSLTEQNRLIENWDSRPYWWEEIPELVKSMSEEDKQTHRGFREKEIEIRSKLAKIKLNLVNKEIAENDEIKEANQRRVEANKQARKEDAVWNSLEKEKRLEVCLPEIQKRTSELHYFSRVDHYLSNFKREVVAIQVVR